MEDLPRLLSQSDQVLLCLPVAERTRGIIGREALVLLPRGATLVNAARGGLLDEEAPLAAISEGRLAGAGLDVSRRGVARRRAANVRRLASGEPSENCVNPGAVRRPAP